MLGLELFTLLESLRIKVIIWLLALITLVAIYKWPYSGESLNRLTIYAQDTNTQIHTLPSSLPHELTHSLIYTCVFSDHDSYKKAHFCFIFIYLLLIIIVYSLYCALPKLLFAILWALVLVQTIFSFVSFLFF